jgi:AcrR family transcriptional regulator
MAVAAGETISYQLGRPAIATPWPRLSEHRVKDVIIEAAKTVFLRDGYRASTEAIIREAGIARQSLYNHFKSKRLLFKAVIEYVVWQTMRPLLTLELAADMELPDALRLFGETYMTGVLHPDGLAVTRLVSMAVFEFPELGGFAYEAGPQRSIPILAAYLKSQVDAGKIRCSSPDAIAESFFGALAGPARFRYMLGVNTDNTPAQRKAYAKEVVALYVDGLHYYETSGAKRPE